jgi:hypothetical protein
MSIERTSHMVIALGLFERMSDAELEGIFTGPNGSKMPAAEVRKHLADLRSNGYEYYPCACEEHGPKGECLNGIGDADRTEGRSRANA